MLIKTKKVEEEDTKINCNKNDTPIHIASINGHLPIVEYLIEKQQVDIEIKGKNKITPLHYACQYGHLPIVEYLISKGANIVAKDESGNYVIHYAAEGGLLPIVQYLIEKQNIDKDIRGWKERTPLHVASIYNHIEVVKYLVSKGANKNAKKQIW